MPTFRYFLYGMIIAFCPLKRAGGKEHLNNRTSGLTNGTMNKHGNTMANNWQSIMVIIMAQIGKQLDKGGRMQGWESVC